VCGCFVLDFGMWPVCMVGRSARENAGRSVAVLGGGHSAIGTLLELAKLKEQVPATEIV